jgi:ribosome maturation factor RimP
MISKKTVEALINERIAELANGLFIVELTISSNNVIQVEIDKNPGNVSVMDCMSVSRNVEHNLDREEEDFEIQVSSAGLDKPFRVLEQFEKNIGRSVKVVFLNGKKMEGVLIAASAKEITLETSRVEKIEGKKKKETIVEQHVIQLEEVKETKIIITFK